MDSRAHERIPVTVEFHTVNTEYYGTITNVSAGGLYFRSQKFRFPLKLNFDIYIPHRDELLKVRVKIARVTGSNGYYDGAGVEVVNPSCRYIEFVEEVRSTCLACQVLKKCS